MRKNGPLLVIYGTVNAKFKTRVKAKRQQQGRAGGISMEEGVQATAWGAQSQRWTYSSFR